MSKMVIEPCGLRVQIRSDIYQSNDQAIEVPVSAVIPHLQLRVAWAYGAEIEVLSKFDEKWHPALKPNFGEAFVYRIKPSNPNADEIASIREEMLKLEKRLGELS